MARDLTAIESMLAEQANKLSEGRKGLLGFCREALERPYKHTSQLADLDEYAAWAVGFSDAMSLVIAYIESASPDPTRRS
jgi:hypothetical protein